MQPEEQPRDIRIDDGVCEMLRVHSEVDTSNIQIEVRNGEVTLMGSVPEAKMKFIVEDLIHDYPGVRDVWNLLKVKHNETIFP